MISKKLIGLSSIVSVGCFAASLVTYAAANDASVNGGSMGNSYINLTVEQDPSQGEYLRYRLNSVNGLIDNKADDGAELTYKNFYSGITAVRVNNQDYIYGRGETVDEPAFDTGSKCHTSSQRFGDVVIEQKLSFSEGFTKGFDDMLKISYRVLEAGENDTVGVDIIIDPMIGNDDRAKFTANGAEIRNEAFFTDKLPTEWKAEMNSNSAVAAYGKTDNGTAKPDSLNFGNWDKMYNSLWNYSSDINEAINDGAVSYKWEASPVSERREFTAYYGIKNYKSVKDGNKVSSPKTGNNFPLISIVLMALSVAAASASIIMHRREKNNAE